MESKQQQQITETTQCGNSYSYMSTCKDIADFRTGNKPNWHNLKLPKNLLGMIVNDFKLKSTTPKDIMQELLIKVIYSGTLDRIDEINKEYEFTYGIVEHVQPVKQPVQLNKVAPVVEISKTEISKQSQQSIKTWLSTGYTIQEVINHIEFNCKKFDIFKELDNIKAFYGVA